MALTLADQESLHRLCTHNREILASVQEAGCFYCCALFTPAAIADWVDGPFVETGDLDQGITALCPECGIDSVIPGRPRVPLTVELLTEMRGHWF